MIKKISLALFSLTSVLFFAAGCSTISSGDKKDYNNLVEAQQAAAAIGSKVISKEGATVDLQGLSEQLASQDSAANADFSEEAQVQKFGSLWKSDLFSAKRFKLKVALTAAEQKEAKILSRSFEQHMERAKPFMHYLLTALKERNLPAELAAVPLVESGFKPRARSNADAHGPWQFTRQTGKSFGLEVSANYDEFYDFIKSTEASLNYLTHLHNEFKNWDFALIAYNQGEFGVKKALRKAKAMGIKEVTTDNLPVSRTAKTYIKRIRSYAAILQHPENFGVQHPLIANRAAFKQVDLQGLVTSMREVAHLSGVALPVLKHLNAGYLTDSLASKKKREILVPIDNVDQLEHALRRQLVAKATKMQQDDVAQNISFSYQVQVAENVKIATRNPVASLNTGKTTVQDVQTAQNITFHFPAQP